MLFRSMPVEVAYQRVLDGKGTQFDPELVGLFEKDFSRWVEFHENYHWNKDSTVKNI